MLKKNNRKRIRKASKRIYVEKKVIKVFKKSLKIKEENNPQNHKRPK